MEIWDQIINSNHVVHNLGLKHEINQEQNTQLFSNSFIIRRAYSQYFVYFLSRCEVCDILRFDRKLLPFIQQTTLPNCLDYILQTMRTCCLYDHILSLPPNRIFIEFGWFRHSRLFDYQLLEYSLFQLFGKLTRDLLAPSVYLP